MLSLTTRLRPTRKPQSVLHFKHHLCFYCTITHCSALVSKYFSLLNSSPNLQILQQIHAKLLKTSVYNDVILNSKLIIMYSKHKSLFPNAYNLFLHMPERNIYSWNIIIGELSRSGYPLKAIETFKNMRKSRMEPDLYTLPLVLRACATLGQFKPGQKLHCYCEKVGSSRNVFVASALVFFYAKFGEIDAACQVFDEMTQRDHILARP
ncbi:hypothetical protein AMTR_s00101p00112120 [Amborella trichopoda]|uniref:Pentacotripeptide-repeat region of PRORP domain-containing protein n=1 Tax=Amborella trichopoda TaxID=13333 RepID=W1NUU4_AMBTC|nr:hypothetical protein AMTR_s00101p00112120 [Amborella trichopoda]